MAKTKNQEGATQEEENFEGSFDSKAMLLENGKKGTIIRYSDRLKVEIIKETRHYKVGDIINPHKVKAEALIKDGIAKEVKEK